MSAPTRVAEAIRKNLPAGSMPYSGPMKRTITDHSDQMENPMCSETTEKRRFRIAIRSPFSFQKVSFSGSHSWIHRPPVFPPIGPPITHLRCVLPVKP